MISRSQVFTCPLRTPIGKFGGALAAVPAAELAAQVLRAIIERTHVPAALIDEVIVAQSYQSSEAPCMGRYAAALAGLPDQVPGYSVDRRCGSGLQALINGAMQIQTGAAEAVLVAGVESMSNIEYYSTDMRWGARMGDVRLHDRLDRGRVNSQPISRYGECKGGATETAENLVNEYRISREQSDQWALRSHQRAAQAWAEGRFDNEVLPVVVPQRKGPAVTVSRDEGIRQDVSLQALEKLSPLLRDGSVTAGNAAPPIDGVIDFPSNVIFNVTHLRPTSCNFNGQLAKALAASQAGQLLGAQCERPCEALPRAAQVSRLHGLRLAPQRAARRRARKPLLILSYGGGCAVRGRHRAASSSGFGHLLLRAARAQRQSRPGLQRRK